MPFVCSYYVRSILRYHASCMPALIDPGGGGGGGGGRSTRLENEKNFEHDDYN